MAEAGPQPGVRLQFIEVTCPDRTLHRRRLEQRRRGIVGFHEPTWASVESRRAGLDSWLEDRLALDSTRSRATNLAAALSHLCGSP